MSDERAAPDLGYLFKHPRFYAFCRFVTWLFTRLCRAEYRGRENIPLEGPVIIATNHRSHVDPPFIGSLTSRHLCFVAKSELHRIPVLGTIIRSVNAMSVRRGEADLAAVKLASKVLQAGHPVVIFPEGTRSPTTRLLQPELGLAMLALRTKAPIVPVAINGTEKVMSRRLPFPLPRKFTVTAGPPITFPELYTRKRHTREDYEVVVRTVMERIAEMLGQEFVFEPHRPTDRGGAENRCQPPIS